MAFGAGLVAQTEPQYAFPEGPASERAALLLGVFVKLSKLLLNIAQ